jgi:chemotaxis protein methyltransferase CheR
MSTLTMARQTGLVDGEFLLTAADFKTLAAMLHADTGITLHEGKATLLYSRLAKRLRALGMTGFQQYSALIADPAQSEERGCMVRALTTNVTRFFREPHHFEHLRDTVLPPLLQRAQQGGKVRIWSAACSSGQEPYSIALTLLRLQPNAAQLDIKILATDIDATVLAVARQGCYGTEAMAAVPNDLRTRWFDRVADGMQANETLRSLISFRELNLIGTWPMRTPFDAIMCRNVVIYFAEQTQAEIWQRFKPLLKPGGHLYIGHSERLSGPAAAEFATVGITTYQRRGAA